MSPLAKLFCALACLSSFLGTFAVPLNGVSPTNNDTSLVPPPRFVIYGDKFVPGQTGPPPVSEVKGYNVYVLSFLLSFGAWDKALEWTWLSASERATIKQQYAAAGIKIMVAAFGGTDTPTSMGADPVKTANTMAEFVKKYELDGIDIDYEDFDAINAGDGKAEAWVITFTKQLRSQLPKEQYIITHARKISAYMKCEAANHEFLAVAPWFSPIKFAGGAYYKINADVGDLIDWYNVQFYNQGVSQYTTCDGLLYNSTSERPESSVFQIANKGGVPLSKLVIGKPASTGVANNGFMSTATLSTCLQQAKANGWNGGAMVWQFPDASAKWIQEVRSLSFPHS
ncbi:glycoside hydrolase family 18 protein [Amanita thiersii Skay4041]|uniref:Glycoside hydrolase family 18 protein n=1 Tax=Amanita thiersii Skay4041 TaxID=703135 RepID=A0A2A9NVR0_9AGAR|nr:glycoside hydrolase family 18 protein [Amanita thiersii Skay4041]